jgi:hypothetical protein
MYAKDLSNLRIHQSGRAVQRFVKHEYETCIKENSTMKTSQQPPIVQAAQEQTTVAAALAYAALGLSIIPLDGKRPALTTWTEYQQTAASPETIRAWSSAGLMKNIGIICGRVSGSLVVLDLDGAAGYPAFVATFPTLAETYTVASGGGVGKHVYFYADSLPL